MIKAAVWKNETESGTRYSVTVRRLYREGAYWHSTESFGRDDLLLLAKVAVNVRFKGGAISSFTVARNLASYETWTTNQKVVEEIDRLLDHQTYSEIAATLNQRKLVSGQGRSFEGRRINLIRRAYGLKDRRPRLAAQGLLTGAELAVKLGTTPRMVKVRRLKGTLPVGGRKLNDNGSYMYENPDTAKERATTAMSGGPKEV
jgi:hypothetical protein